MKGKTNIKIQSFHEALIAYYGFKGWLDYIHNELTSLKLQNQKDELALKELRRRINIFEAKSQHKSDVHTESEEHKI